MSKKGLLPGLTFLFPISNGKKNGRKKKSFREQKVDHFGSAFQLKFFLLCILESSTHTIIQFVQTKQIKWLFDPCGVNFFSNSIRKKQARNFPGPGRVGSGQGFFLFHFFFPIRKFFVFSENQKKIQTQKNDFFQKKKEKKLKH